MRLALIRTYQELHSIVWENVLDNTCSQNEEAYTIDKWMHV